MLARLSLSLTLAAVKPMMSRMVVNRSFKQMVLSQRPVEPLQQLCTCMPGARHPACRH